MSASPYLYSRLQVRSGLVPSPESRLVGCVHSQRDPTATRDG